jgi:adenosine deaminase
MSFIDEMPKVDLHNHLDGGLRPETVTDIAQKEGIALPTYDVREIRSYLTVEDNCGSLVEYLEKFDLPLLCLQSEYAQRRVAKEAVEDAAKQNVKYIEVRFAPQLMVERGLSCSNVIKNVIDGLKDGEKETGTVAGAIVCCMRHHTKEQNLEAIRAAAEFLNRGLAGVDLAGDEFHFPPQLFREEFKLARSLGIPVTIHAGEAGGPENIKEAVENLGAARIGHGIRLKEDKDIYSMVRAKNIPLEICVTSNVQTKAAPSFHEHPVREYFDDSVNVTINTDNTTVSNTNITRELKILTERFGFDKNELEKLELNAARAAFLSEAEKNKLVSVISNEFEQLTK